MTKIKLGKEGRFFTKFVRKAKSIMTGLKKIDENFWVYSPFTMPVQHIQWAKRLNAVLLHVQIACVMRILRIRDPLILVGIPSAADVVMKMKKKGLIYQRTDRFEESVDIDVGVVTEYDRTLKAIADVTIYVNRSLYDEEKGQCRNPLFLDHGVDYDLFAGAAAKANVPADMVSIPKPIAGYFGAIHWHSVDLDLAGKIADLLPDVSFVYVGPGASDCTALSARKNVWMLGSKDYYEIPHYGKCFDVAILPWTRNRWTLAANPIKVKEYLALRKPFVITPAFTEIDEYLDVTYVARSPEEFAACIIKAMDEDSGQRITRRREKVKESSWAAKAQILLDALGVD